MDVRLRGVRYTGFDVDPTTYDDDSTISSFTSPRTKSSSWSKFIRWIQPLMRNKMILLIAIVMMAVLVTTVIVMKLMPNDRVIRRSPDIMIPPTNHDHHGSHHGGIRVLNAVNRTYALPEKCENTRQGKEFITDDTGAICSRNQVVPSGCCDALIDRLSCASCRADVACCSSYEYCVSCCLKNTQTKTIQFPPSQYNKCLATCRTSSRSLKHGNKYKHKHKYCYTEGDHDIAFNKSSAKIMAAERGYSCSLSCQSQRLVCHDTYLPQINNCDYLKRHFPCEKGCENGQGSDQPAYVVPDAPESFPRGLCLVNTDQKLFDCESAHENTRRLCVCIPPEAVDQ